MTPMNRFFSQMVCPFWIALQSCAEMLASDAPSTIKVDALVSWAVHTFNRPHSDLNRRKTAWDIGSTVIRKDAEYFRSEVVGHNHRVTNPRDLK
jgi:hypothetical protein